VMGIVRKTACSRIDEVQVSTHEFAKGCFGTILAVSRQQLMVALFAHL
jgi:hypothetical protein